MNTLQFKTNIKCSGCVEKVTPFLNNTAGSDNWSVDLQDPAKLVTIPNADNISSASIIQALENAGYKAEKI